MVVGDHETVDRIANLGLHDRPVRAAGWAAWLAWVARSTGRTWSCEHHLSAETGLGITVGFHRLFTHRSFKTGTKMRILLGLGSRR